MHYHYIHDGEIELEEDGNSGMSTMKIEQENELEAGYGGSTEGEHSTYRIRKRS